MWQHGIPQLRTFEDRDTGETVRKIWGGNFNCLENETAVLQHQNKRTHGERDVPPQICPLCKTIEHVRGLIHSKKISKATPVFRFEVPLLPGEDADDRTDDQLRVISAGGFTDTFKGDLSPQEKIDIRKAGISLMDAWRENARAKCNFVFRVVDHDNLDDGVQILIETSLVGEKVQQVILDQMKRLGRKEGNPLVNPYAFQIEHKPKEKQFQNKYHVLDLSPKAFPMTGEIRALIVDTDPPDITRMREPGNVRQLRQQLEQYCLIDMPWDQLFGPAEALQANQSEDAGDTSFEFGANEGADEPAPTPPAEVKGKAAAPTPPTTALASPASPAAPASTAAAPAATSTRRKKAEPTAPPPPVEPMGDPCDDCGHAMKVTDTKCPGCGAEYAVTEEAPAAAAPAQPSGTVVGADGVVAGSPADKLNW